MPERFINLENTQSKKDNKKTWDIEIPEDEIVFTMARSSGPGGQNVNKVETKVILKWPFRDSKAIDEEQEKKIETKLVNRINREGELVIHSSETRSQLRNKQRAIFRLHEIINRALKEEKKRVKTKPGKAAQERRLQTKKITSRKKGLRRQGIDW